MEVLAHLAISITGFIVASALVRETNFGTVTWLAYPAGVTVWVVLAVVLLMAKAFNVMTLMLGIVSVIALAIGVSYKRISTLSWGVAVTTAATLLLAIGLSATTVTSYDSLQQILFGRALGLSGQFDEFTGPLLASWGVFLPSIHAIATVLGLDYFNSFQPIFAVLALIAVCALLARQCLVGGASRVPAVLISMVALAYLATTPFLVFQAHYVHNSMLSAAFLAIAILGTEQFEDACDWRDVLPCLIGLLGFVLQRTEAPLFVGIWAVCALTRYGVNNRALRQTLFIITSVCGIWYFAILVQIGAGSEILTPSRALIVCAPLVACTFYLWLLNVFPVLGRLVPFLSPLMALGGAMALVVAMILGDHIHQSLTSLLTNLKTTGMWGYAWVCVVPAFVVAQMIDSPDLGGRRRFYLTFAVTFLSVLLLMSLFRSPFRVGWGDSANRIMTHLFVLILMFPLLTAGACFADKVGAIRPHRSSIVVVALLIASFVVASAVLRGPVSSRLVDAAVVAQPKWRTGHDLRSVLKASADETYLSPPATGPVTVELELLAAVSGGLLEVRDYSQGLAMTDYAWSISAEGNTWKTVYDSNIETTAHREFEPSPLLLCYPLDGFGPVKFLRLEFRSGLGQDRLLLRRLRLFAPHWAQAHPQLSRLLGLTPSECLAQRPEFEALLVPR